MNAEEYVICLSSLDHKRIVLLILLSVMMGLYVDIVTHCQCATDILGEPSSDAVKIHFSELTVTVIQRKSRILLLHLLHLLVVHLYCSAFSHSFENSINIISIVGGAPAQIGRRTS